MYEAEVDENEDIQHTVLTVTAKDHDECKYQIWNLFKFYLKISRFSSVIMQTKNLFEMITVNGDLHFKFITYKF